MRGKAPSFPFYPDAWLSSTDISLMTPAEEGAYHYCPAIASGLDDNLFSFRDMNGV